MHAIHVISKLNLSLSRTLRPIAKFLFIFREFPFGKYMYKQRQFEMKLSPDCPHINRVKPHGVAQKTTDHLLRLFNASNSTEFIPTCLIKSLVVSNAVCSSSSCSRVIVTTASVGPFLLLLEVPSLSLSELAPLKASAFMPSSSARAVN